MALTSVSTQLFVVCSTFIVLVLFHCGLLYHCKSKWITSLPTKSICLFNASIFALICGWGGLYVWYYPTAEQHADPLHGGNLFQEYICLIGVGYFVYDVLVVLFIDPTVSYLIHAVLSLLFAYLGGVIPLASHSGSFVMAFEISTPFKNVRYFMIKWGYTKHWLFRITEMAFIASFVYIRLVVGLPAMYEVTDGFLVELDALSTKIQTASIQDDVHSLRFRLYSTYFLLYGGWANVLLNVYWSYAIFKAIILFSKHRGDYTPNDENEIVYDTQMELCPSNPSIGLDAKTVAERRDALYFGELYFRNAPLCDRWAAMANDNSAKGGSNGDSLHIDVYQNDMAKTYYKCDIGAVWMNLKSESAIKGNKQWVNGLLSWQRQSHFHFGDAGEPLLKSVERLLHYHSTTPLVPALPNYHCDPLETVKYGNIYLLTLPKTCGIGWHPLSVYYCFDEGNEELITVLFEMINMPWSRRHVYVLPLKQYGSYNEHEKQYVIQFMKICPFCPMDFTHFNGRPNGYCVTINDPRGDDSSVLKIHGHVFSLIDHEKHVDSESVSPTTSSQSKQSDHDHGTPLLSAKRESVPSGLIHEHEWGTSSCIIPKNGQQIDGEDRNLTTSPVIEFGLNHCTKSEVTSSNLMSLLTFYPFSSFVLRFQLYLFPAVNWLRGCCAEKQGPATNGNVYSKRPCHGVHVHTLSVLEVLAEALKVSFGAMCFLLAAIWNVAKQCRRSRTDRRTQSMVNSMNQCHSDSRK